MEKRSWHRHRCRLKFFASGDGLDRGVIMGSLALLFVALLSFGPIFPALAAEGTQSPAREFKSAAPTNYSHRAFDDPAVQADAHTIQPQLIEPAAGDEEEVDAAPPPEPIDPAADAPSPPPEDQSDQGPTPQDDPPNASEGESPDGSQDD